MKIEKMLKKLKEYETLLDEDIVNLNIFEDGTGSVYSYVGSEKFEFNSIKELSQKLDGEIAKHKSKEIEFNVELCKQWANYNTDEIVYCNNDIHKSISWAYGNNLNEYYWLDKSKDGIELLHSARPLKDVVLEWARERN